MIGTLSSYHARNPPDGEVNGPRRRMASTIDASQLRDVATQARLVAAVDGSLGVLVNLWAGDERLHPGAAPGASRRRGN